MLHNKPYNEGWSQDINTAWYKKDVAFFKNQVTQMAAVIAARDSSFKSSYYDPESTRLLICLALVDCLEHGGETTGLILDVVNF